MTTLTKLLPENARPAQALLNRAHPLTMTHEARTTWTKELVTAEGTFTVEIDEPRALLVDDVFVDAKGEFYVVRALEEPVLYVTGDIPTMNEAVQALLSRGLPVGVGEEGFYVLPMANIAKMLKMIGLDVTEQVAPFKPVRLKDVAQESGGCGCGGSCSCDSGDSGCGSGGCGCGSHDHEHDHHHHGGCGCGSHDHDHDHHHHHDHHHGGCGCGGHDHDEHEGCCGGHDHDHGGCCHK